MKRLLLIALTSLSIHAIAQTNTFPSSGNVGIGTTTPSEKLVVNGSSLIGGTYVNSNNTKLFLQNNAGKTWAISSGANMISENFFSIYNWTDNATQPVLQINESGCVGITANPSDKLQIGSYNNTGNYKINIPGVYNFEQIKLGQYGNGACGLELINHSDAIPSYGVKLLASVDNGMAGLQIQTSPPANSYNELDYKTQFAITTKGNIGIGTINPTERLTIAGGHADTKLRLYSTGNGSDIPANLSLWASEPGLTYYGTGIGYNVNGSPHYGRIDNTRGSSYLRFLPGETKFEFQNTAGAYINAVTLKENGNVGIGTTNPAYKLDVLGTIRAKEVLVNLDGGADFVFEKGYQLLPIEHVANYVQKNKHLPDIPSANEMVKNGVSMGDMQVKLLQKVEELTLYAIQQDKSKKELEAKLAKQENQYNALLEKVEMLTKQIEKK